MALTVQQAIDLTREVMNAVGSAQWSDAILKRWVGIAHWKEWADLLNVNNGYNMQQVNVSQDSNGRIPLSDLNDGGGNSEQFWYRVLSVAQPGTSGGQVQYFYRQAKYRQFPNPQPNTSLPYVWYRFGDQMQVLPVASGQSMTITTNWRPTRADNLLTLVDEISFPNGYEDLIPWRAAVLALTKGGSEVQAAADINAIYTTMHDEMLLDLGRESVWPIVAEAFDLPEDWAG
jgi:hypothetical protein